MSGKDTPYPAPARPRHESGTYQRKEVAEVRHEALMDKLTGVSGTLRELKGDIDRRLDGIDGHVRRLENEVTGLREQVSAFRQLVDRVHTDYDEVREELKKHDGRLDALEVAQANKAGQDEGETRALAKRGAVAGAVTGGVAAPAGAGLMYWILKAIGVIS